MTTLTTTVSGPHTGQPVFLAGTPLDQARAAMLLLHGRGAPAQDILGLATEFDAAGFVFIAPQAAGLTWYPHNFLDPIASNEPWLSSALAVIDEMLTYLEKAGIALERTMLLGFSQGACLSLEYVARHAQRYGGGAGLSGGLIGPDETPREARGSLAGTPVFLGCSDVDFYIPKERVQFSAQVLQKLGGEVTTRLYPRMGHTVNQDEISFVNSMMNAVR